MIHPQPGDFRIDAEVLVQPRLSRLVRDGRPVPLERKAIELLVLLADHAGEVVSRQEILDRVWEGVVVTEDVLYRTVSLLRGALETDPSSPRRLRTIRKVGYQLVADVAPATATPPTPSAPSAASSAGATGRRAAPAPAGASADRLGRLFRFLILAALLFLPLALGGGGTVEPRHADGPPAGVQPIADGRPGLVGGLSLVQAARQQLDELLADPAVPPNRLLALAEQLSLLGLPGDLERAVDALTPRVGELANEPATRSRYYRSLAALRLWFGELDRAESAAVVALSIERRRPDPDPLALADAEGTLGDVLAEKKERRALELLSSALERTREAVGNETGRTARAVYQLALGQWHLDNLLEAELYARQAWTLAERVRGDDPLLLSECDDLIAATLWKLGRYDEALEIGRRAYRGVVEALGDNQSAVMARVLSNVGVIYLRLRDYASAQSYLHQARALSERTYRRDSLQTAVTLQGLAIASWRQGDLLRAEALQRQTVEMRRRLVGVRDPFYASSLQVLSLLLIDLGQLDEAERTARRSLDLRLESLGEETLATTHSLVALARVELAIGRPDRASALLRRALEIRRGLLGDDSPLVGETRDLLLRAIESERPTAATSARR